MSREIWATKKGKVYFSYHAPDFWLWELDVKSGVMQRTQQRNILSNGYLHGMVATRDGNTVYLLTNRGGNLYSFDVEAERLKDLGSLLPARGDRPGTVDPIRLRPDSVAGREKAVYPSLPIRRW